VSRFFLCVIHIYVLTLCLALYLILNLYIHLSYLN